MTRTRGRTVVITGAGSGIGRALAVELAARGCRLALTDVDVDGLGRTVQDAEARGADVLAARLDVTDHEALAAHAQAVEERFGPAELVFNNAGIAHFAWAQEQTMPEIDRVLDVNLRAVIAGSQVFLPHVMRSGGHLVNVSSLFGLLCVPGQSAYHASKFGVRGYTEALAVEARAGGHRWRVSCVHPGGIDTAIARSATYAANADRDALVEVFDALARTSPGDAARIILRGVERDKVRIHVGRDAKILHGLVRLLGIAYQRIVARAAGRVPDLQAGSSVGTPATDASATAAPSQSSRTA